MLTAALLNLELASGEEVALGALLADGGYLPARPSTTSSTRPGGGDPELRRACNTKSARASQDVGGSELRVACRNALNQLIGHVETGTDSAAIPVCDVSRCFPS
jgi:hypothetical protein